MMFRWYTGEHSSNARDEPHFQTPQALGTDPHRTISTPRALVADTSNVVPGWFWFAEMTPETVSEQLFVLAEQDPSVDVRRRALWLLREAGILFRIPMDGTAALGGRRFGAIRCVPVPSDNR